MNVPSSTSPSSTFWIIDTTSVSGTFTTTANFTLWVPLNTPFTSSAPSSSSTYKASETENSTPRSYTPVIAGSVIGSILGTLLVLLSIVFFYRRRARPRLVLPRTRPPVTPSGSEHALLDLTAEPAPHPENIEPWVAPAVVRRPAKGREEAVRDQGWVEDTSGPRVEGLDISGRAGPSTGTHGPRAALQGSNPSGPAGSASPHIQGTETQGATAAAPAATGHGPVQEPSQSQPRLHLHQPEIPSTSAKTSATPRRRAVREPSPPRVEEDAGISLMRAEEEVLPPSYGDLVHDRLPTGSG
ncbi:hypothetical protein RSOLAG1IB_11086 [Rhizoctonia solani AG-1 IB]|uniref:Uncharacterized protein n=1 Tax=Thanatephorus cucumeris (strain AG1-IB / isolate 7/3/14) TaxID=1108050 RepID=A0A0B7F933_THACB|nr:hypothetical protein RSOLAG1IB_11086 [Rhizoctonia solani AG-1 IB]